MVKIEKPGPATRPNPKLAFPPMRPRSRFSLELADNTGARGGRDIRFCINMQNSASGISTPNLPTLAGIPSSIGILEFLVLAFIYTFPSCKKSGNGPGSPVSITQRLQIDGP